MRLSAVIGRVDRKVRGHDTYPRPIKDGSEKQVGPLLKDFADKSRSRVGGLFLCRSQEAIPIPVVDPRFQILPNAADRFCESPNYFSFAPKLLSSKLPPRLCGGCGWSGKRCRYAPVVKHFHEGFVELQIPRLRSG
jgi:hypothetical protein